MNVLIDVIDPRHRNEMMVLAVRRALFGELDLVGTFEMIDLADGLLVGRNDIHMFPDLGGIRHGGSPENGDNCKTSRRAKSCAVLSGADGAMSEEVLREDKGSAAPLRLQLQRASLVLAGMPDQRAGNFFTILIRHQD
jgi:hypothetical protein